MRSRRLTPILQGFGHLKFFTATCHPIGDDVDANCGCHRDVCCKFSSDLFKGQTRKRNICNWDCTHDLWSCLLSIYSLVTFGYLTDKGLSRALTIAAGGAVVVIGTLLIDPAWFGVVWPSFVYPGIVVGLLEAGSAMVQVSALPLLVLHDEEPDIELSTEKMTRVYNTGFFIESFIGPLVGSALLNFLSFSSTFTFFAVFTGAVIVLLLGFHLKTGTLLSIRSKVANLNEYTILS